MRKQLQTLSALALLLLVSCSSQPEVTTEEAVASTPRFVMSLQAAEPTDRYWSAIQQSALEKAKEVGAELVTTTASDAQNQLAQLENEIANGVTGIAVAPFNAQMVEELQKKAEAANIPFILIDNGAKMPNVKSVGTNEEAAGRLAADYVCNPESAILVNESGFLARNSEAAIITGAADDPISQARAKGGRWGLEDCSLKVIAEQSANNDPTEAEKAAGEIIAQHPNVKVLIVTDDTMALGAAKAVKTAGKTGEVVVISFGGNQQTIEAIINGELAATIAPNPQIIGARSVESLYMLLDEQSIPDHYDTGTMLVTIHNAAQFRQ